MTKTPTTTLKDSKNAPSGNPRKWRLVSQWEKTETDYEMYIRIKEENKAKEKKKSDRAIKKLKKDGKVQSISGFLICKEEKEDDWIGSKKDKSERNHSRRHNAPKACSKPSDVKALTGICHELDSNESDNAINAGTYNINFG